jgi:hypothetical protein
MRLLGMMDHLIGDDAPIQRHHPGMKTTPRTFLRCTTHTLSNKIHIAINNIKLNHSTMGKCSIKLIAFSSTSNISLSHIHTHTNFPHSQHTQSKCLHGTNTHHHTIPQISITQSLLTHTPYNTFPIIHLTLHSTPTFHNNPRFLHPIQHLPSTTLLLPYPITMIDKLITRIEIYLIEAMGVLTMTMTETNPTELAGIMIITEMLNSINPLPKHLRWISLDLMVQTQKNGFV